MVRKRSVETLLGIADLDLFPDERQAALSCLVILDGDSSQSVTASRGAENPHTDKPFWPQMAICLSLSVFGR